MKIGYALAVVLIFVGVLGYVIRHEATPAPSPSPEPGASASPSENSPASTQSRIRISSGVAEGMAIYKPAPQYPQMARIAHISGDVVLDVTIDRTGQIANIKTRQGHPILIQSAIDAVKQWKFRPYVLNGEAVEVESTVMIKYHM